MKDEQHMTEQESLQVISTMIAKAKQSYHETGYGPLLWGIVISFCSLVTWGQMHYGFSLPFDIWFLAFIAVIPTIIMSVREQRKKKVHSYDDTAMSYTWTVFGVSMFILIFINMQVGELVNHLKSAVENLGAERPKVYFSDYNSAYMMMLYGIPTVISAGIKKFRPMLFGGIFCWVGAITALYTSREIDMLLMAASAIFAWLIPGIVLFRKYIRKKRQQHV